MAEQVGYQLTSATAHEWSHLLLEITRLEGLKSALRNVSRLKFTCLSVSHKYLAFGSNTGGIYIYSREKLKHLQIVFGDQETAQVTQVALSPNEKIVGFSTVNGHVIVMELNIEKRTKPERLRLTADHRSCSVTCLHWNSTSTRLFMADNMGKVTVALVPHSKAKNFFVQPSEVIMVLESAVVQLDWSNDKLLVSTMTRCYLCNTVRHQYSQIGKKLRDGAFGSCFYKQPDSSSPAVYCSRPGSRIWEVDFDGNVLSTHQFKQLLALPPLPIISTSNEKIELPDLENVGHLPPQAANFYKLKMIGGCFLLAWTDEAIYIINPVDVKLILWSKLQGIHDIACYKSYLYVFYKNSEVCILELSTIQKCVSLLVSKQCWKLSAELCSRFGNTFVKSRHALHMKTIQETFSHLEFSEHADLYSALERILLDRHIEDASESESEMSDSSSLRDQSETSSIDTWNSGMDRRSILSAEDSSNCGIVIDFRETEKKILHTEKEYSFKEESPEDTIRTNSSTDILQKSVIVGETVYFEADFKGENETLFRDCSTVHSEIGTNEVAMSPSQMSQTTIEDVDLGSNYGENQAEDSLNTSESSQSTFEIMAQDVSPNTDDVNHSAELSRESKTDEKVENSTMGEMSKADISDQTPVISQLPASPVRKNYKIPVNEVDIGVPTEIRIREKKKTGRIHRAHSTGSLKENKRKAIRQLKTAEVSGTMMTIRDEALLTEEELKVGGVAISPEPSLTTSSEPSLPMEVMRHKSLRSGSPGSHSLNLNLTEGSSYSDQSVSPSPKAALLNMKDRLITHTKRLLLKTIADKNILQTSPKQNTGEEAERQLPIEEQADGRTGIRLDMTELVENTEKARTRLNELSVVMNPEISRKILKEWVICLNSILQRLHSEMVKLSSANDVKANTADRGKSGHALDTLVGKTNKDDIHPDPSQNTPNVLSYSEVSKDVCTDMADRYKDSDHIFHKSMSNGSLFENTRQLDWENICHTKDPFHLNTPNHDSASELAMCCFDLCCYGDICKFVKPASTETLRNSEEPENFCSPVTNGSLLLSNCDNSRNSDNNFVKSMQSDEEKSSLSSAPKKQETRSESEMGKSSQNDCHSMEEELDTFVRCHYHLLNVKRIRQTLYNCDEPSYILWCTLLTCAQDMTRNDYVTKKLEDQDVNGVLDYLQSGNIDGDAERVFAYLAGLFKLSAGRAVDYFTEARVTHPVDILFLCRHTSKPAENFFHKYMLDSLKLTTEQNRNQLMKVLCASGLVRRTWFSIMLSQVTSTSEFRDSQGKPRFGSHKLYWPQQHYLNQIIDFYWEENAEVFLKMCTDRGYWVGCLRLYKKLKMDEESILLLLELGDLDLVGPDFDYGYIPHDMKDCQLLLNTFSRIYMEKSSCEQSKRESSDWLQSVTWEKMAYILVRYLGPLSAVKLLESVKLPDGSISNSFYQMCLAGSQLHMQQREVVHHMLEKIDTYLWAKKPTHMAPQLYFAVLEEKQSQKATKENSSFKDLFSRLGEETLLNTELTAEDPACHWGTQARINSLCPCCNIPVMDHVSHVDPGAIVFQCGHSFHKHCVPDRECVFCVDSPDSAEFV